MTDPGSTVLEHSRLIRSAIDNVRGDSRERKQRVGSLENQYADMSNRLGRMDVRVELRLDLTDA